LAAATWASAWLGCGSLQGKEFLKNWPLARTHQALMYQI
jgi:hypothetical protein